MKQFIYKNRWFILLSSIFFILSYSLIYKNGSYQCIQDKCGLYIGQWHLHDALWHISLAKLGFDELPPQNPYMTGVTLTGYNYLLDLIIHLLYRLNIDPFITFFKILPLFTIILYIVSVYIFTRFNDQSKSNLLSFFLYFGSSMSFLIPLYHHDGINYSAIKGFPVVTSLNPSMMTLNMQYGISLSLILLLIKSLGYKINIKKFAFQIFIIVLLFGLKFYAGAIAVLVVSFEFLYSIFKKTIQIHLSDFIAAMIGSTLGYLLFYKTNSLGSGLPFEFSPFALTHLMIDDPLLFYNHSLTLARYYLLESKVFSEKLILIEFLSIVLFIAANFGIRFLGVIYGLIKHQMKIFNIQGFTLAIVSVISFIIPILYIQKGGWYNTMQFLYYGVWFASILTGYLCYYLLQSKNKIYIFLTIILLLLNTPNHIDQLRYISEKKMIIGQDELIGLNILKNEPEGVVHINNPFKKNGLVPALAEKRPYYLDTDQLMVTGVQYKDREDYILKYRGASIIMIPADYYYIDKKDEDSRDSLNNLTGHSFKTIYDSNSIAIIKRRKD